LKFIKFSPKRNLLTFAGFLFLKSLNPSIYNFCVFIYKKKSTLSNLNAWDYYYSLKKNILDQPHPHPLPIPFQIYS